MELIRGRHNLRPRHRDCVVTVGNFDGLHRGHQALIDALTEPARAYQAKRTLVTFEPLPREYFSGDTPAPRIASLREKCHWLAANGMDQVLILRFDDALAAMPAEAFVRQILVEGLGAHHVIIGDDFRFGRYRAGDLALLQRLGAVEGFTVAHLPPVTLEDERVSSSRVRAALNAGEIGGAERLLGRPFRMCGRVSHGDKRGRTIGFPTLNLRIKRRAIPIRGVFAVEVDGVAESPWPGIANVGYRPTVDGTRPVLEVHLFDYAGDLYGRQVCTRFHGRIRDERRFPSLDALIAQIEADAAQAREWLGC